MTLAGEFQKEQADTEASVTQLSLVFYLFSSSSALSAFIGDDSWTPLHCLPAAEDQVSLDGTIEAEEEKKKLVGSLDEKKLPTEGCTERNDEREKSSGQKNISDDRRQGNNYNLYFNPHYPFLTCTTSALNGSYVTMLTFFTAV
ncbi:hypothetical protein ANN_07662 [Periplaneta americana]|uniref:Uncharacterized protein n=1 Tax=Periplaneta americana TaxID=6978 RepID=A0ABQ8SZW5_PERAM|nr:hypothetical protein ANN_07662 [Periplaneta americana]